jgi:hypothetical protein
MDKQYGFIVRKQCRHIHYLQTILAHHIHFANSAGTLFTMANNAAGTLFTMANHLRTVLTCCLRLELMMAHICTLL